MRKLGFLLILSTLLLTTACNKEDDCLTGKVRLTSLSDHPYDLYLDGAFSRRIQGNTFVEIDLIEGQHRAKVEQVSGYLLFPTVRETTLNVFGCKETEWVFP
jgi:hypothetical protein